jgi:hypothetical protein
MHTCARDCAIALISCVAGARVDNREVLDLEPTRVTEDIILGSHGTRVLAQAIALDYR